MKSLSKDDLELVSLAVWLVVDTSTQRHVPFSAIALFNPPSHVKRASLDFCYLVDAVELPCKSCAHVRDMGSGTLKYRAERMIWWHTNPSGMSNDNSPPASFVIL